MSWLNAVHDDCCLVSFLVQLDEMGFFGILVWHSRKAEFMVCYKNDTQTLYNTNP